jgi:DtxR family Mn-dependent transcriptional regulator
MDSNVINLLIFFATVLAAVLLFSPRFGLLFNIRNRWRDIKRIRLEDALKHIYMHEHRDVPSTLSSVANALRISSKKALALTNRMQNARLISVVDGRILLTESGEKYALQVLRAHRLWELYLADETGVDPSRWHSEAELREHALTPEKADALAQRLGNPRFDPHGDPIPTANGELPEEEVVPLTKLEVGDTARVAHIEDKPDAVYAQIVALGIYLGMELVLTAKTDDRLIVEAEGGRSMVLAPIVAGNVSIHKMTDQEKTVLDQAHETLASLGDGEAAEVVRISPACRGSERRRLMDLGILPGTAVEYDRRGLTGGLTSYRLRGTVIALRSEQAEMISIHNRERIAS